MPTYSYRCTDCGHAFDIQQAFTDDSLTECPECGGRLRKVFDSIAVTFNGSGFYRTDSRADKAQTTETGGSSDRDGDKSGSTGGEPTSGAAKESSAPKKSTEPAKAPPAGSSGPAGKKSPAPKAG